MDLSIDDSTVDECLTQAQDKMKSVHQSWTIVALDLFVAMKTYKMAWQYEEMLQKASFTLLAPILVLHSST